MTVSQILLALVTAPSLPLDGQTTGLWAARWVTKRLFTAYTGPLIRVRRSNDDAEADIGYGGDNLLDQAALAAHVGSNSGYITKIYDQFASNHLQQTTNSKQPRIVNAGTYDGKAVFDGTDDALVSATTIGTGVNTRSSFAKLNLRSTAATQLVFELSPTIATNDGSNLYYDLGTTRTRMGVAANSLADNENVQYTGNKFDGSVLCFQNALTAAFSGWGSGGNAYNELWDDGTAVSEFSAASAGTNPNKNFANTNEYWAARGGTSIYAALDFWGSVVYHAALTGDAGARIASISSKLA